MHLLFLTLAVIVGLIVDEEFIIHNRLIVPRYFTLLT